MSLPFTPIGPPPLPPGWTEHISKRMSSTWPFTVSPNTVGPTGQPYYFNAAAQQSTYVRPLPIFPVPPAPVAPKKKERPLAKTPIPGTDWTRVKTTEGNTFYTHKVEKRSVWTVPDEIRDAVAALEEEEDEAKRRAEKEAAKAKEVRAIEMGRIKSGADETAGKRKAEEPVPMDEVVITKKQKFEEEEDEEEEEEESEEEEEEEEWQREAAAQLAAEAEEEKKRHEEERKRIEEEAQRLKEAEKAKGAPQLSMPDRVDLSLDEAKALFKVCSYTSFTVERWIKQLVRHYCVKRMSTLCIHGIPPFLCS